MKIRFTKFKIFFLIIIVFFLYIVGTKLINNTDHNIVFKIKLFVTKFNYKFFIRSKIDNELKKKNFLKRQIFKEMNFDLVNIQNIFKILTTDLKTKRKFFIKKY